MATRSTEAVRNGTDADGREPGPAATGFSERYVPGTGSPMRWFFSGIWLVYLISPVSALFGHHHGVAWIAGGLAITVAFCVIYMLVLIRSDTQPRLARAGLAAIALLAALACAVYGKDWLPLWIYVSAATRHGARGRARRAAGGHARGGRGRGLLPVSSAGSPTSTSRTPWSCCCRSCSSAWP